MVCSKCEKKLSRGIHQEMWKEGSRNTVESEVHDQRKQSAHGEGQDRQVDAVRRGRRRG